MTMTYTPQRHSQPVPESKFRWFGVDRGYRYGEHNGTEYAVMTASIEAESYHLREGELFVSMKRELVVDGSRWDEVDSHLAQPVPAGSWKQIAERQAQREARRTGADQPLRPWSALDLGKPKEPLPTVLGALSDNPTLGALQAATGKSGPLLLEAPEAKTITVTPAGFLEYFASRGIELHLAKGQLVAKSRKPISKPDAELLLRLEDLLTAHLQGKPLPCVECSKPATTIVLPRAAMCQKHADQ